MSNERSGTRKKYVDQCASSPGTFIPTNYQICSYLYPCDAAAPCCTAGCSDVADSSRFRASVCIHSINLFRVKSSSDRNLLGNATAAAAVVRDRMYTMYRGERGWWNTKAVQRGGKKNTFTEWKKKKLLQKIFGDTRAKAGHKHTGLPAALNLKHSDHKHSC